MAVNKGTYYTSNLETETSLKRDVYAKIFEWKPVTPFTQLLNKLSKDKPTGSYKHEWFDESERSRYVTISTGLTTGDVVAAASITLVAGDGSLIQADTILYSMDKNEVIRISVVTTDNISVERAYMSITTAITGGSLSGGSVLYILPDVYAENGSIKSCIVHPLDARYNLIRIMRTPVEETWQASMMNTYAGDYRAYLRRRKAIEHAYFKEKTFLFESLKADTTNKKNLMWGLIPYIRNYASANVQACGGTISYETFVGSIAEKAFAIGSRKKFMLAGSNWIKAINKWNLNTLVTSPTENAYGLKGMNVLVPFGDGVLEVYHEPAFEGTVGAGIGLILDMEYIREVPLIPLKLEQNVSTRSTHVFQDEWVEYTTLRIGQPSAHFLMTGCTGGA